LCGDDRRHDNTDIRLEGPPMPSQRKLVAAIDSDEHARVVHDFTCLHAVLVVVLLDGSYPVEAGCSQSRWSARAFSAILEIVSTLAAAMRCTCAAMDSSTVTLSTAFFVPGFRWHTPDPKGTVREK